ncbi:MAG: tryptophan synthase subunit alpha [Leptonema sp. (in: bacteria)]
MNLSNELLKVKKEKNAALFMPYLTLGDPDFFSSIEFANSFIQAGVSIIELGIPFSDPTADGPIIQKAMVRAAKNSNFSLETIFETSQKIYLLNPKIFLIYLTYLNPIVRYNQNKNSFVGENFLKKCSEIGIRGLVIPDLPFDSYEFLEISEQIQKHNLPLNIIPMIAPNTPKKRIQMILTRGNGFVYYITSLGVTGFRNLPSIEDYPNRIDFLRKHTELPIFAGFGIHKPEQAKELKKYFDGIIVGSLYHKTIEDFMNSGESGNQEKLNKITREFYEVTKNFVDSLSYS